MADIGPLAQCHLLRGFTLLSMALCFAQAFAILTCMAGAACHIFSHSVTCFFRRAKAGSPSGPSSIARRVVVQVPWLALWQAALAVRLSSCSFESARPSMAAVYEACCHAAVLYTFAAMRFAIPSLLAHVTRSLAAVSPLPGALRFAAFT